MKSDIKLKTKLVNLDMEYLEAFHYFGLGKLHKVKTAPILEYDLDYLKALIEAYEAYNKKDQRARLLIFKNGLAVILGFEFGGVAVNKKCGVIGDREILSKKEYKKSLNQGLD